MQNPASSPIHVYFALLPGSLVLDWAGPAEALRIANQTLAKQGQPERFVQHFVSPTPESVSSVGAVLTQLEPLPANLPSPAWVVLVGLAGQHIAVDGDEARALLHWLRGLRPVAGQLELITVCAGAVLAVLAKDEPAASAKAAATRAMRVRFMEVRGLNVGVKMWTEAPARRPAVSTTLQPADG